MWNWLLCIYFFVKREKIIYFNLEDVILRDYLNGENRH